MDDVFDQRRQLLKSEFLLILKLVPIIDIDDALGGMAKAALLDLLIDTSLSTPARDISVRAVRLKSCNTQPRTPQASSNLRLSLAKFPSGRRPSLVNIRSLDGVSPSRA